TVPQVACLDFAAIAEFWRSDLGGKIREQARFVQRELAFTARFSPNELAAFTGGIADPQLEQEYVVVQGVPDLAVSLPREIWLIDFKTDSIKAADLPQRVHVYQPQLQIYAAALSRSFHRPVSQTWLYFLELQKAVAVETTSSLQAHAKGAKEN